MEEGSPIKGKPSLSKAAWTACKPRSVRGCWRGQPTPVRSSILSPLSPWGSSSLPGARRWRAATGPRRASLLLDLAPDGGCLAAGIATSAGGLLHHLFTLTSDSVRGGPFLWPYPRVSPPGHYPASCSAERGLSSDPLCPRSPGRPRQLDDTFASEKRQRGW